MLHYLFPRHPHNSVTWVPLQSPPLAEQLSRVREASRPLGIQVPDKLGQEKPTLGSCPAYYLILPCETEIMKNMKEKEQQCLMASINFCFFLLILSRYFILGMDCFLSNKMHSKVILTSFKLGNEPQNILEI